jgi:hypothetical protein
MPKAKQSGEFDELVRKSQKDVVAFNEAVLKGFTHGANPQFTYVDSFAGRENNKANTFNLISDTVLIPWRLTQEDGTDDAIHLAGHLNATLTFGYLTKQSITLKVSKTHLTVRRMRAQQSISDGEANDAAAAHIGGVSSGGWTKRADGFDKLLKEILEESTHPDKTKLITKDALSARLDEWISIATYNEKTKQEFYRELKSNVEKIINAAQDAKGKPIVVKMDELEDY